MNKPFLTISHTHLCFISGSVRPPALRSSAVLLHHRAQVVIIMNTIIIITIIIITIIIIVIIINTQSQYSSGQLLHLAQATLMKLHYKYYCAHLNIKLQVKGGKTQADGIRSNISPEKSKGEKDRDQGGGCHGRQVLEEDHLLLLLGEDRAAASLPGAGPPPTNLTTQTLPAPVLPTKQLNCSNFPPI